MTVIMCDCWGSKTLWATLKIFKFVVMMVSLVLFYFYVFFLVEGMAFIAADKSVLRNQSTTIGTLLFDSLPSRKVVSEFV